MFLGVGWYRSPRATSRALRGEPLVIIIACYYCAYFNKHTGIGSGLLEVVTFK